MRDRSAPTCRIAACSALFVLTFGVRDRAAELDGATAAPRSTVFATSRFDINEILKRPFTADVPMGCTGDRVWATHPHGWAFRDDVHWINFLPFAAFDLEIRDDRGRLEPAGATYYPSHIHYEGAVRREMTAAASFTFALDRVENPLTAPFLPEKRWTCWSSGVRRDWYEVDFGVPRLVTGFDLFFFDDAPTGECRPPGSFEVQYPDENAGGWSSVVPERVFPDRPRAGENRVRFAPVRASRFRFVFQNAGNRFYTGLYGVVPDFADRGPTMAAPNPLKIECDKFITATDTLVSILRIHNPTSELQTIYVDPVIDRDDALESWHMESQSGSWLDGGVPVVGHEPRSVALRYRQDVSGNAVDARFRYAVIDQPAVELTVSTGGPAARMRDGLFAGPRIKRTSNPGYKAYAHRIAPGKTKIFKAVLEMRLAGERSSVDDWLVPARDREIIIKPGDQDVRDILSVHQKAYQSWFDANLPYFDCSDPWIRKLYYHRAYLSRKNMLDPRLGRLRWPTQSEGRWRSDWYANVISYGAAHQIREAALAPRSQVCAGPLAHLGRK